MERVNLHQHMGSEQNLDLKVKPTESSLVSTSAVTVEGHVSHYGIKIDDDHLMLVWDNSVKAQDVRRDVVAEIRFPFEVSKLGTSAFIVTDSTRDTLFRVTDQDFNVIESFQKFEDALQCPVRRAKQHLASERDRKAVQKHMATNAKRSNVNG